MILKMYCLAEPSSARKSLLLNRTVLYPLGLKIQVYCPERSVWVGEEPFPTKEMEGRLSKGRLPVPKEVNRKKDDEPEAASLTPRGSRELHSPRISYLYSF
ncbi:neuronal regeneration-related protein isoform X1 [Saccopteryx bilineata]|uniref:neuronal regeneration-related protein isoform X1 n=1 Tax=Saccopteryx bilineata TaxID=59482 RepID=UPI00338E9388